MYHSGRSWAPGGSAYRANDWEMSPKRRSRRQNERRSEIVATARILFFEEGYADATMSRLAARLGGSKSTLWSYYASKEQLLEDVVDEVTNDLRLEILKVMRVSEDLFSTLHSIAHGMDAIMHSFDVVGLTRIIMAEGGRFVHLGRIYYERVVILAERELSIILGYFSATRQLSEDDPCQMARAFLCLCGCFGDRAYSSTLHDPSFSSDYSVREGVRVFLRVYGRPV